MARQGKNRALFSHRRMFTFSIPASSVLCDSFFANIFGFRQGKIVFKPPSGCYKAPMLMGSVTRFGDLLDFGKLFKAFGNN